MDIQDYRKTPKQAPTGPPGKDNYDSYGDGDIPEIDTTRNHSDATNQFPDEMPRRGQVQ